MQFDQTTFNWENMLMHWINNNKSIESHQEIKNYIRGLFENYFPKFSDYIMTNKVKAFAFKENFIMHNLLNLFEVLILIIYS